jgi:hypothetical protein
MQGKEIDGIKIEVLRRCKFEVRRMLLNQAFVELIFEKNPHVLLVVVHMSKCSWAYHFL